MAAPEGEEYKKGVDMTIRQFQETLQKLGLEEIEADGAAFNPEWHNAVMREDADGVEPDTITAVSYTHLPQERCRPPARWPDKSWRKPHRTSSSDLPGKP